MGGKSQKLKEIHTKEHSVKNKSKEKMAKERDIGRRLSVCEAKENKLKRIHGERCEKRGKLATSKTASKEKKRKADERQTEARAAVQEKEMQCTLLKELVRRRDGNERKLKLVKEVDTKKTVRGQLRGNEKRAKDKARVSGIEERTAKRAHRERKAKESTAKRIGRELQVKMTHLKGERGKKAHAREKRAKTQAKEKL